jgi:hypothetical protein
MMAPTGPGSEDRFVSDRKGDNPHPVILGLDQRMTTKKEAPG